MRIECKSFSELDVDLLYKILQLRQKVFIVEQNCIFNDIDDLDQVALHCIVWNDKGDIAGYTRLFDKDVVYAGYASIGRVVSEPTLRHGGFGRIIFKYSIDKIYEQFGIMSIKIGAQAYLETFYASFGFVKSGEPYLEDGIWHIHMVKTEV